MIAALPQKEKANFSEHEAPDERTIFLDIDGVLNNTASLSEHVHLLPEKCLMMRRLCKETGAHVCISSAWGEIYTFETLRTFLHKVGFPVSALCGVTPRNLSSNRQHQIRDWYLSHPCSYVIIDDDLFDWLPEQKPRVVQTRIETGLVWRDVDKVIELFASCLPNE